MHILHSVEVKETDDGKHAIIIKLGGALDNEFEPFLRLEFDKTLARERTGGVILDLSCVSVLTGASRARIRSFTELLFEDGIELVIVTPKHEDVAKKLLDAHLELNMVPTLEIAKEILAIAE